MNMLFEIKKLFPSRDKFFYKLHNNAVTYHPQIFQRLDVKCMLLEKLKTSPGRRLTENGSIPCFSNN